MENRSIAFPAPSQTTRASEANPTIAKRREARALRTFSRTSEQRQNRDFKAETYDASARAGEHHGSHWNDGQQPGQREHVAPQAAKNHQGEPGRESQFHESGEVVAIYEWTEGIAAFTERA